MKENYVVTQGNNLIEARHKKPLNAREQKIILTMVSMINPTDEDFREYVISIKDFHEMLGLQGREKYTEIKMVVENLMSKVIEIPREDGGWLLTHWVSTAEYMQGKGAIRLKFVPELKPYMLQLKSQFTSYRLSNILSLNSTYSIRLYELMKKWQHLGKWDFSVEELRSKLGVGEKKYPRYANFKARVLMTAIEEVNEKTDLYISINENKNGRSVERIGFIIQHSVEKEIKLPEQKQKPKQPEKVFENEDVRTRLNALAEGYIIDQFYFAQMYQGASFIWNDDAEKELSLLIHYVNEEESVKNPLGFIKKKLQDCAQLFQEGLPITFANLQSTKRKSGREEKVPDWFSKRENTADVRTEDEKKAFEEERRKLLEELGIQDGQ